MRCVAWYLRGRGWVLSASVMPLCGLQLSTRWHDGADALDWKLAWSPAGYMWCTWWLWCVSMSCVLIWLVYNMLSIHVCGYSFPMLFRDALWYLTYAIYGGFYCISCDVLRMWCIWNSMRCGFGWNFWLCDWVEIEIVIEILIETRLVDLKVGLGKIQNFKNCCWVVFWSCIR